MGLWGVFISFFALSYISTFFESERLFFTYFLFGAVLGLHCGLGASLIVGRASLSCVLWDQTHVLCIARRVLNPTTREVPMENTSNL